MNNLRTFKTGITTLDNTLPGGIPRAALVLVNTDPESQGEKFVHNMIDGHKCTYITTIGNEEAIEASLKKSGVETENISIESVSYGSIETEVLDIISHISEERIIVIDSINTLEDESYVNKAAYRNLLNKVQNLIRRTGGCVIFRRMYTAGDTKGGFSYMTESMVDYIFSIEQVFDGDDINEILTVPKARATAKGEQFDTRVKINIGNTITIDTSRDIA